MIIMKIITFNTGKEVHNENFNVNEWEEEFATQSKDERPHQILEKLNQCITAILIESSHASQWKWWNEGDFTWDKEMVI